MLLWEIFTKADEITPQTDQDKLTRILEKRKDDLKKSLRSDISRLMSRKVKTSKYLKEFKDPEIQF